MIKTTLKAFHGRHILTRQIANSRNLRERALISYENDIDESEEEKMVFADEMKAFGEAIKEEMSLNAEKIHCLFYKFARCTLHFTIFTKYKLIKYCQNSMIIFSKTC